MEINLQSLKITNFRGIASFEMQFTQNDLIKAPKGTGKTSLIDSLKWLFGAKNTEIFPTINGNIIKNLETAVVSEMKIDSVLYEFKRISNQTFKENKFDNSLAFVGNESKYFINGLELKLADYCSKLQNIFGISYSDLQYILDISVFNNEDWKVQRKWLFEKNNIEQLVASLNEKYDLLTQDFKSKFDETDIQKQLNQQKQQIKRDIDANLATIKDRAEQIAKLSEVDFDDLENKKDAIYQEIVKLNGEKCRGDNSAIQREKMDKLNELNLEYTKIQAENNKKHSEYKRLILDKECELSNTQTDLNFCKEKIEKLNQEICDLVAEKEVVESEQFDAISTICPTCNQTLPINKIEEAKSKFIEVKKNRILSVDTKTQKATSEVNSCQERLTTLVEQEMSLKGQLETLNLWNDKDIDTTELKEAIELAKRELDNVLEQKSDTSAIDEKLALLKVQYENCISQLSDKKRLQDLKDEVDGLKKKGVELATLDQQRIKKQSQLFAYIKEKIQAIDETINSNFENVKFSFQQALQDTAEKPFENTCEVALNKVGYSKLSKGQKIEADYFVQLGLQKMLGVKSFIFVDEIGSTSIALKQDCQTIRLFTIGDVLNEIVNTEIECNFKPVKISTLYEERDCFIKDIN